MVVLQISFVFRPREAEKTPAAHQDAEEDMEPGGLAGHDARVSMGI